MRQRNGLLGGPSEQQPELVRSVGDRMSSFDYHIHADLNLIEVRPTGVVEISDIMSYAQEALSLDIVTEGTIEYYDPSKVTDISGDYTSAMRLTGLFRKWFSCGWQGGVFFAPQDHQFGMIRMISAIAEGVQGAPAPMLIPRREPTALGEVRDFLAENRQIS